MKRTFLKRLLPLLLCTALLLSCCPVFADDAETDGSTYVFPERTPVAFEDMSCDNFDADRMQNAIDTLTALLEEEDAFEGIKEAYDIIVDEFDKVNTDYNLAYIYYCMDASNDELYDAYCEKEEQAVFYSDAMCIALSAAMESQYADQLKAYINSDRVVEDVSGYTAMTEEDFALSEENTELINEYWNMSEDATSDDYGELYLRLLDNLIASAADEEGYESYTAYVYENSYFRDYAPEETETLYQWAKDFAVPAFFTINNAIFDNYEALQGLYELSFTEDEIISTLRPYLSSVSDITAEAYEVLTEYHLYDLGYSETKNDAGYTTELYCYGVPFIYNAAYNYFADMETLVHEFGHFAEGYNNDQPMLYVYDCIDTDEIDSQGMEMLMLRYADEIYGEDYADVFRLYTLYSMFSAIIDGCIFDEFQQRAVEMRVEGTLTTGAEVTELYNSIEAEYYGEYVDYFGWGDGWYQVHHTFESPFYYISYATSATAALGFLVIADEDYDTAVELYNELIEMGSDKGFKTTLDTLGLPDPLTEEGCAELTDGLTTYINDLTGYDVADMAA